VKKIGFIDHYLDEWHANNFPQWIRESSFAGRIDLAYAWAERDKEGGLSSRQWCERHQAELTASLEELVEKSDYLVVLAPDHSDRHEELAALALASRKPVYIDKTFAPDLAAARRLFARAAEHATPLYSASALRFAEELDALREQVGGQRIQYAATGGPGRFAIYAVHQLEMLVAVMGAGAVRVMQAGLPEVPLVIIDYPEGRRARLEIVAGAPFSIGVQFGDGKGFHSGALGGGFFPRSIEAMLAFFESGQPPVAPGETLEIMALLDAGKRAMEKPGQWIELERA
jgi:predicted dehydrogenase